MATSDDWVTVALPRPVIKRVDDALEKDSTYRSRGELVKALVLQGLSSMEQASA